MRARQCGEARCSSKEDALPSAELQPSVGDGDAELGLGQRALDVGRHVVRPFVIVAVERDIFWHDAMQKSTEVAPHIGRCNSWISSDAEVCGI